MNALSLTVRRTRFVVVVQRICELGLMLRKFQEIRGKVGGSDMQRVADEGMRMGDVGEDAGESVEK